MKIKDYRTLGSLIRQNYLQLVFVVAAFTLMALTTYFFVGRIMERHLLNSARDLLDSTEANVRAGLSETETTLINSCYIVEDMIDRNAPKNEILDYLVITTNWMRQREEGLFNFYGVYGYINGELYDGIGWNPGSDFIPQTRSWYQTAIRSGNTVAYTSPYMDEITGNSIVSAVHPVAVQNGDMTGILAIDVNTEWLTEYVTSLSLTPAGYGILISQNMTLMAYSDPAFLGRQLQELGSSFNEIARELRNGEEVFARKIINTEGVFVIVFFKQIFNGWYVGIVTPYYEFYENLYISALILIVLGLAFSVLLSYMLLRLSAAKVRSDEENRAKSSFLARMSHEIRTPMNAITGMAELLLRGELSEKSRAYAHDIKQAASNLISIINDILDFSKIEAGGLEILPVKYLLPSLVNDAVSIIRMRLMGKPIRFFTNIDSKLPNGLTGDEVRMRQIILNLLSNAAKYTERGYISMSITVEKKEEKQVWIKIAIGDSGQGIKPEDREKLFGDFVQVDTQKNRSIEGTGLGLAITKRLCMAMGGDITVESVYGKGSTFTAVIPQVIESDTPFAAVEEPEQKKVLIYERRTVYANSVGWSLKNMGVPHTLVTTRNDFAEALYSENWYYVFSGYGLYDKIRPLMNKDKSAFFEEKKPPLALMVEVGTEPYIPGARYIPVPVQSLSIANVLNGQEDNVLFEGSESFNGVQFTLPHASILVVDDIATNLKVAEGLLAPYKASVETCLSGADAVELVRQKYYDIVFMDHMMPEMDGIETTAAIRELDGRRFKLLPIIALTANAVSGMKEMFLEKGFNGFLAKPIDVSKLDETLNRWIPKEKKEKANGHPQSSIPGPQSPVPSPLVIPGVDTAKGISMTGGTVAAYRQVLSMFRKDAVDRLPLLKKTQGEQSLPLFVTQVHALKSASASLGAENVSAEAARLEAAGKEKNLAFIERTLPGFTEQLAELAENIRLALDIHPDANRTEGVSEDKAGQNTALPIFRELAGALKSQKVSDIDSLLDKLSAQALDSKTKDILEKVSDDVLMSEFDNALKIIEESFIMGASKEE